MAARRLAVNASRALAQRAAAPAVRSLHTTRPAFGKEYTGYGLETDPNTGVRINKSQFMDFPGQVRGSEYQSPIEQDPKGNQYGTGGNDDIWGEWGLNRCTPQLSTEKGTLMLLSAFGGLYLFGQFLVTLDHPGNANTAPREGVWGEGRKSSRV